MHAKRVKVINLVFFKIIVLFVVAGSLIQGNCGCDGSETYIPVWVEIIGVEVPSNYAQINSNCWPGSGFQQQINTIYPLNYLLDAVTLTGNGGGVSLKVNVKVLGDDCAEQDFVIFKRLNTGALVRGWSNPGGTGLNCISDVVLQDNMFLISVPDQYNIQIRTQLLVCSDSGFDCYPGSGSGFLSWYGETASHDPKTVTASQPISLGYLTNIDFNSIAVCESLFVCQ